MKAHEIVGFLESEYPLRLQSESDNSGLQTGSSDREVRKVAVAFEKTLDVILECVRNKCDMLITHRPLSLPRRYEPLPRRWLDLYAKAMADSDMVIYSMHENLDLGTRSTGMYLCRDLGLELVDQTGQYLTCRTKETTFEDLVQQVRKALKPDYMIAVGDAEVKVRNIGIVAGTAMDLEDIEYFKSASVECYISGDPDDFGIRYSRDVGLMTINVDDYSLERPAIIGIQNLLANKFNDLIIEFIDCRYQKI